MRLLPTDKAQPRFSPKLAKEIGLTQSFLLLQIDFWLDTMSGRTVDGTKWVRISITKFRQMFPFMTRSKIGRVLEDLYLENLIVIRKDLNRKSWDKTQWFSLNEWGINRLKSIGPVKKLKLADPSHFGTTIPDDILSEYHLNRTDLTASDEPVRESTHEDEIEGIGPEGRVKQKFLFVPKRKSRRTLGQRTNPVERVHHGFMYELCYGVMDGTQASTLNSKQRGRVADALAQLSEGKADLDLIPKFNDWWLTHWQSKSPQGGYQAPRPDQVVEFWWMAMRHVAPPKAPAKHTEETNVIDFDEAFKKRALARKA
jgi:hypothetical protein